MRGNGIGEIPAAQEIHAVEAATGNLASGLPNLAVVSLKSSCKEVALFCDFTWHLSSQCYLSLGARQSRNDQSATEVGNGPLAGDDCLPERQATIIRRNEAVAEHLETKITIERLIDAGAQVVGVGRTTGKAKATQLEFDIP